MEIVWLGNNSHVGQGPVLTMMPTAPRRSWRMEIVWLGHNSTWVRAPS